MAPAREGRGTEIFQLQADVLLDGSGKIPEESFDLLLMGISSVAV
jgi:hypothetical protein